MHNVIVGAVDADRDFVDSASEWYRFRIAPDVDLKRVVRTIRRALPVATHQRWCRAYPKTFTGAACVDLILAHKLAGSRDEAVEIASYLTARSFLQDAIDPRRPFRDGRRALFRLNSAERVDAQALALGLQNNLRFETRLYKGAAFDNCFLGRDAVAFMIEAGLANSVAQALDFGNYLKSLDRLHHAQNPSLPLMNTNDPYRLAHGTPPGGAWRFTDRSLMAAPATQWTGTTTRTRSARRCDWRSPTGTGTSTAWSDPSRPSSTTSSAPSTRTGTSSTSASTSASRNKTYGGAPIVD